METTGILRGLSTNYVKETPKDWKYETDIWHEAHQQSEKEENKTAITVMLEDFAELSHQLDNNGHSCIKYADTKPYGFWEKLKGACDNIFRTERGRRTVGKNGPFKQDDIFKQEMMQSGGIKYASSDDDIAQAALNFAKADINAIETAYGMAYGTNANGALSEGEITSYSSIEDIIPGTVSRLQHQLSFSEEYGAVSITPEEYASYMMAIDSLGKFDGKVSISTIVEGFEQYDFEAITKVLYKYMLNEVYMVAYDLISRGETDTDNRFLKPIIMSILHGPYSDQWSEGNIQEIVSTLSDYGIPLKPDGTPNWLVFCASAGITKKSPEMICSFMEKFYELVIQCSSTGRPLVIPEALTRIKPSSYEKGNKDIF